MDILRAFGWAMLILGSYYLAVGVIFAFPKNRAVTCGKLVKTKGEKNARIREYSKIKVVPHWTQFTYRYTVNGKTYHKSGGTAKSPRQLPYQPTVVYMKWMPRYGFVRGLTVFQRPFWGFFLLFVAIILLIIT